MMGRKQHKISAKNFQEPLLRVLGEKGDLRPNRPVYYKDAYTAVCEVMSLQTDDYGAQENTGILWVERWIQWAFKALKGKGLCAAAGRGKWALTPLGVQKARSLTKGAPTTPAKADPPKTNTKAKKAKSPISMVPVATCAEDAYHPDPYIRSLAIKETDCFDAFSTNSTLCGCCPLQGPCLSAQGAHLSRLSMMLAEEDGEAERKAAEAARKDAEDDADDKRKAAEKAAAEAAKPQGKTGAEKWGPATRIVAQQPAVCPACDKDIQQQEDVYWVRSNSGDTAGLFHIACYEGAQTT
jgi:hypothetical protein